MSDQERDKLAETEEESTEDVEAHKLMDSGQPAEESDDDVEAHRMHHGGGGGS